MKISTKSRYASRLMLHLALKEDKGPIQLSDISKEEGISEKYLSQIVIPLKHARFIQSVRGAQGGYLLNKSPKEITLLDIVSIMEGGVEIVSCLKIDEDCDKSTSCVTRQVWSHVSRSMEDTLRKYTLEYLVELSQEVPDPMYYI